MIDSYLGIKIYDTSVQNEDFYHLHKSNTNYRTPTYYIDRLVVILYTPTKYGVDWCTNSANVTFTYKRTESNAQLLAFAN